MPVRAAQSTDDSQSRPPVSKSDVQIVRRARQILDSPDKWNRADNRICPDSETKFSLYCALEEATYEVTQDFAHRGAAMQESRFVIDDDLAPNNHYHHRLMDYNNDPQTSYADVQRFFDFLQARIEGRLEEQEVVVGLVTEQPATVSRTDIEITKKVETILDSPAKWDRVSKTDCKADAHTFTVYCAFQAASIAVTGNPHYDGPALTEADQLVERTAPNIEHYNARMNYNNDPGVTFQDMQKLLKTVETNLEKRVALQGQRDTASPTVVTQTDIEIIKKVQTILDSPSKWDKSSSQDCAADAKTFGLYCAFKVASIAVTGKPNYDGPAIREARQLISRAPHAVRYSARLVDYNNDPTTTFGDLQSLLKTVETNLEKRMAAQGE
jgi:hypothetical protein